jgi:16S rRNA (uracil1498-N3)-methyltransferase
VPRFFLPPGAWAEPCLEDEEARHCAQVHRSAAGDQIDLIDGAGRTARARVLSVSKTQVRLELLSQKQHTPRAHRLALCPAITKGESFEWLLEKAVELGVTSIHPVLSERVIVRLSGPDLLKKQQKWQRQALEACKQSGQPWLPAVHEPQPLSQLLSTTSAHSQRLCAALLENARRLSPAEIAHPADKALLVGPEGDFSSAEYAAIGRSGWLPWSLGSLTLRSETAAVHALSLLSYHTAP